MKFAALSTLLGLASLASARTDLEGCVSSTVVIGYGASLLWYVPDSGEICSFLDCGGGRAPPKTNVPGCGGYHGTATVTPDYIEGWGPNGKQAASTTTVLSTSATAEASPTVDASITTQASETSTASSSASVSSSSASSPENTSTASDSTAAGSMTITTSPSLATAATSTAATSSPTFNAANGLAAKGAGVMAIVAAMVGAIGL
ncbi:uncharacterized protein N7515_003170 [Penicillium bovifimosum]|uniref:Siderophore biosynthesis n=1 Tax=Penicillium bovifimosum TaxID=126998 RepID=A0A9W9H446_9EURO|nr:uncharacterized protein N7515_003170 [Penicillium bovifimosum]KAJ5138322.1 hypothetical protein N7515_003170 [Penicillium bovifimosum]